MVTFDISINPSAFLIQSFSVVSSTFFSLWLQGRKFCFHSPHLCFREQFVSVCFVPPCAFFLFFFGTRFFFLEGCFYASLHVFHRQLAHHVSGPRYQAKIKKSTWPSTSWLRYQAKKRENTWPTPTWLRLKEKKSEHLAHPDLVRIRIL